jgi:uncharacterized membrane protein YagU involved in acid resistance
MDAEREKDLMFWIGVVSGIVATLVIIGTAAGFLFRALNDGDWEHKQ